MRLFTQTPTGFTEDTVIAPVFDFTFSTGTRLAADFDGDGRLDFAFLAGGFAGTKVLQVWRNTPQGFEQVYRADFSNRFLTSGILLWGDLDNDGLPDLIAGGVGVTTWLRWDGSRMIADTSTFPVLTGTANVGAMLDIDGDRSLDLTLDGILVDSGTTISKLYLNRGQPTNTGPTAPSNLRLTRDGLDTLLRWDAAMDDLTPSPVLTQSGGTLTFTFPRSDDSEADFLLHAEISGDLQQWTPILIGPENTPNLTTTENGPAPDRIQFTLPTVAPAPGGDRRFVRLSALGR